MAGRWDILRPRRDGRGRGLALRYRGVLKKYFEKRLRIAADVEDLVQEVFVRLAHRPDLASIERIDGYIFQVAANILRDRARREAARRVKLHDSYDDELHSTEDFSPERVLLGREQLARLMVALGELPAQTRHVRTRRELSRRYRRP